MNQQKTKNYKLVYSKPQNGLIFQKSGQSRQEMARLYSTFRSLHMQSPAMRRSWVLVSDFLPNTSSNSKYHRVCLFVCLFLKTFQKTPKHCQAQGRQKPTLSSQNTSELWSQEANLDSAISLCLSKELGFTHLAQREAELSNSWLWMTNVMKFRRKCSSYFKINVIGLTLENDASYLLYI